MKFCSDLPENDVQEIMIAGLSQIVLLFLMQYEKVCTNLDARINLDD